MKTKHLIALLAAVLTVYAGFMAQVFFISSSISPSSATLQGMGGGAWQALVKNPASFLVTVQDRSVKKEVWTQKSTVKYFLVKNNVPLNAFDRVYPGLKTETFPGMFVKIVRVEVKQEKQKYAVPFQRVVKSNPRMMRSQKKILQKGLPGIGEKIMLAYYKDGKATSVVEVQRKIVKAPVPQIVEEGSAFVLTSRFIPANERPVTSQNKVGGAIETPQSKLLSSPPKTVLNKEEFLSMTATAYTPYFCGGSKSGKTATGIKAKKGVVAVDPRVIPLGTKLYIPGYGYALAADTGSAIKGRRIDLCFNTRGEVSRFGKKKIKVYIVK